VALQLQVVPTKWDNLRRTRELCKWTTKSASTVRKKLHKRLR